MKRISMVFVMVLLCLDAIAQEKTVTFHEKLQLQERLERETLEAMIENSTEEEYRTFIKERVFKSMTRNDIKIATVIVDVTDIQDTSNVLKSTPEESAGSLKLKSIITQPFKQKSVSYKPPHLTVRGKQWAFSNKSKNRHFEQVNIELNSEAVQALLTNPDVKDIFITSGSEYGTKFSAINTELGRFYPPLETKIYDKQFLRKGNMDQLMESFKTKKTALVNVTLRGRPKVDAWKPEHESRGKQLADAVISTLDPKDYHLFSKSSFGFLIEANQDVIQSLRGDDRVDMISETSMESMIAQ